MNMSYIKVNTEFFNTTLNPLEILILALIESYTRDNKAFYHTNDQMAKMFHVSEKTVRNALDSLEAKNYIKRNTFTTTKNGKANRQRTIELKHLKADTGFHFSF
jgi:DNA-binding MarR family transcriptional regulator